MARQCKRTCAATHQLANDLYLLFCMYLDHNNDLYLQPDSATGPAMQPAYTMYMVYMVYMVYVICWNAACIVLLGLSDCSLILSWSRHMYMYTGGVHAML